MSAAKEFFKLKNAGRRWFTRRAVVRQLRRAGVPETGVAGWSAWARASGPVRCMDLADGNRDQTGVSS